MSLSKAYFFESPSSSSRRPSSFGLACLLVQFLLGFLREGGVHSQNDDLLPSMT